MNITKRIGDFLLSTWLWHITFDWFHPIVTGIVMFCLLRFVMRRPRVPSFVMSSGLQLSTFGVFSGNIIFILIRWLGWHYQGLNAEEAMYMLNPLVPSLWVGLVYALIQSLFLLIGRCLRRFNLQSFLVLTWVSNSIGAMISYMLINMVEIYYYIG